jgi:fumarate reductase (CoM/CoB) subunit A
VEVGIDYQRLLGGARINEKAETEVPHLFAAGESAGGLHGADRMQGGAFLETQIFGARAGYHAAKLALETDDVDIDRGELDQEKTRIKGIHGSIEPVKVLEAVQKMMWEQVGVIRNAKGLSKASENLAQWKKELVPDLSGKDIHAALESANLLLTAEMVTHAALAREESRGSHRRSDFPEQDDKKWKTHVAIRNVGGEMAVSTIPVQLLQLKIAL